MRFALHKRVMVLALLFLSGTNGFAASTSLRGGAGDLTPAQFDALGVTEKSCAESRNGLELSLKKTSAIFLAPASFPPGALPVSSDPNACHPDREPRNVRNGRSGFHSSDALAASINEITSPSLADLACVAAAQKVASSEAAEYRACPSGVKKTETPCRSISEVSTMTRALSLASECIGIERKDLFRVASEDTGLVPDAFSARTVSFARSTQNIDLKIAGGPAAQAVADQVRQRVHDNAFCSGLNQMGTDFALRLDQPVCDRMGQPQSAVLPYVFQAKAFLYLKADLDQSRADLDKKNPKLHLKEKFGTEAEYLSALRTVAFLGATVGEVRARAVFLTVFHLKFNGAPEFLANYRRVLELSVPATERKSVEAYSAKSAERAAEVRKSAGGRECF